MSCYLFVTRHVDLRVEPKTERWRNARFLVSKACFHANVFVSILLQEHLMVPVLLLDVS